MTKDLLGRNTPQARQALRKPLDDRIEVKPFEEKGRRGARLTGPGSFAKLLTGEARPLMVVPPG